MAHGQTDRVQMQTMENAFECFEHDRSTGGKGRGGCAGILTTNVDKSVGTHSDVLKGAPCRLSPVLGIEPGGLVRKDRPCRTSLGTP